MATQKTRPKQVMLTEHHHEILSKVAKHDKRKLSDTAEVVIEEAAAKRKIPIKGELSE